MLHYLNGEWVTTENLKISAFDLAVLRGYGLFDFLRTYHKKPFRLDDHITRLYNSAAIIGIPLKWDKTEIEEILQTGIQKNAEEADDFDIRILVTGGVGVSSTTPGNPSLIITFQKAFVYPEQCYTEGAKLYSYDYVRVLPSAKSLNYVVGIRELQNARKQGALEVLYVHDGGKIYEGMTSNFFGVKNGELYTRHADVLLGVTRKVVLELAESLGIPVHEVDIRYDDLKTFDETFITASQKEIMPIVQVDDITIGIGVGPMTKKLHESYKKLTG